MVVDHFTSSSYMTRHLKYDTSWFFN